MTPKTPLPTTPEALFRFQVVSSVLAAVALGRTQAEAVEDAATRLHPTLTGCPKEVSSRSVYRWLRSYRDHGVTGLEPASRTPVDPSRVLSSTFLGFVVDQKDRDPRASIPELISRARQAGALAPDDVVDRVTVWRAARRLNLEDQVLVELTAAERPLLRQDLRDRLRINNARLGVALTTLETGARICRTPSGWALPPPSPTADVSLQEAMFGS